MSGQAPSGARRGYGRSVNGMIGALIACLVGIAGIWGLTWFQHQTPANPVPTRHYASALQQARSQSPFPVVAPDPRPAGLRATSVSWNPIGGLKLWHLGFLTTGDAYIGLYEGTGKTADFLHTHTPATDPGPAVHVNGQIWLTLTNGARGETALYSTENGVTTLVTGTVSESELQTFVAALRG